MGKIIEIEELRFELIEIGRSALWTDQLSISVLLAQAQLEPLVEALLLYVLLLVSIALSVGGDSEHRLHEALAAILGHEVQHTPLNSILSLWTVDKILWIERKVVLRVKEVR